MNTNLWLPCLSFSLVDGTILEVLQETFSDLTEEEIKFIPTITTNHLLMFCTGAGQIPVTGFDPAPSISFVHDESKIVPRAQTCSNVLYLYVNEASINSPIHCTDEWGTFLKSIIF